MGGCVESEGGPPVFAAVAGDKPVEEELKQQDVETGTSAGAAMATMASPTPDYAFYTSGCCKSFTALLVVYIVVLIAAAVLAGAVLDCIRIAGSPRRWSRTR